MNYVAISESNAAGRCCLFRIWNEKDEISSLSRGMDSINEWIGYFPISRYAFLCKNEQFLYPQNNTNTIRGLIMPYSGVQKYGVELNGQTMRLPPKLCVHTIIKIGIQEESSTGMLHDSIQHIHAKGMEIDGDVFGMWLLSARENDDRYSKYYDVWLPIRKNQPLGGTGGIT